MSDILTLRTIKGIIDRSMEVEISRFLSHPEYGWIDMKFDAFSGEDRFLDSSIAGKDHVYSWIQGRGLEALVSHIAWYGRFSGFCNPDTASMRQIADSVYARLRKALELGSGHLSFLLDEDGRPLGAKDGRYTMSDLFCSRGLYAYSMAFGNEEDRAFARSYLTRTVDAILAGRFYNDQLSFSSSQYVEYNDGRTSYAGNMLALGAISLVMKHEPSPEAFGMVRKLIDYVLSNHVNAVLEDGRCRWEGLAPYIIVEWIKDGSIAINEDGRASLDPGHGLEFVGLAAQCLDISYGQCSQEDRAWADGVIALLPRILDACFRKGYKAPFGIVKGVSAFDDSYTCDTMPWWSLAETMRAFTLVGKLSPDDSGFLKEGFGKCLASFMDYYVSPSALGVAIQTIGQDGRHSAVVPATPDIDPGYHTGLSLISVYDAIAEHARLTILTAEADITPTGSHLLSGHAARMHRKADEVMDRLYAESLYLEGAYSKSLLVELDVLELDESFVRDFRSRLSSVLAMDSKSVIIAAIHTHTAPCVVDIGTIPIDHGYQKLIEERVVSALETAKDREPVEVRARMAEGYADFGINRRYRDPVTGAFSMKPNADGPVDRRMPVIAFEDLSGRTRCMLFSCSVHPTTLGVDIYAMSADYPGRIRKHLRRLKGEDVPVIAITGACGDVRPCVLSLDGLGFRDGNEKDIEEIGKRAAQSIIEAINAEAEAVDLYSSKVVSEYIPFEMTGIMPENELIEARNLIPGRMHEAREKLKSMTEFEKLHDDPVWALEAERAWIDKMLSRKEKETAIDGQIALWSLDDKAVLMCVPGELFADVGMALKSLTKAGLSAIVGYSNGSLGYLPSAKAVDEGGYEIMEAYKHVGHAGRFSCQLERSLMENFSDLLEKEGLLK